MAYKPLRHAHIGQKEIHGDRLLPVEWVMLSRWDHDSGVVEFCVEYLDDKNEIADDDDCFARSRMPSATRQKSSTWA